jgi:hypothetical protein
MLTDFDLSKGSSPPGKPGVVKSKSPNQVSFPRIKQYKQLSNKKKKKNSLLQLIQKAVLKVFEQIVLSAQKNTLHQK